jgi:hypothetical protein
MNESTVLGYIIAFGVIALLIFEARKYLKDHPGTTAGGLLAGAEAKLPASAQAALHLQAPAPTVDHAAVIQAAMQGAAAVTQAANGSPMTGVAAVLPQGAGPLVVAAPAWMTAAVAAQTSPFEPYSQYQGWTRADLNAGKNGIPPPLSPSLGDVIAKAHGWNWAEAAKYVDPSALPVEIQGAIAAIAVAQQTAPAVDAATAPIKIPTDAQRCAWRNAPADARHAPTRWGSGVGGAGPAVGSSAFIGAFVIPFKAGKIAIMTAPEYNGREVEWGISPTFDFADVIPATHKGPTVMGESGECAWTSDPTIALAAGFPVVPATGPLNFLMRSLNGDTALDLACDSRSSTDNAPDRA